MSALAANALPAAFSPFLRPLPAHLIRRADSDDDLVANIAKYNAATARFDKIINDSPSCFRQIYQTKISTPACKSRDDFYIAHDEKCNNKKFEDELLGALKCTCRSFQTEEALEVFKDEEKARACIETACEGEDVEKAVKAQKDIYDISLEQCFYLKDYARAIRDGYTMTTDGETVTIPQNRAFPTTAWDFITDTAFGVMPTPTGDDKDAQETKGADSEDNKDSSAGRIGGGSKIVLMVGVASVMGLVAAWV